MLRKFRIFRILVALVITNSEDINSYESKEENEPKPLYSIVAASKRAKSFEKHYPKQVNSWAQYIEGQGSIPKKPLDSYTTISRNNKESARNKPVIEANIAGNPKNVLLDTGSANNVIDYNYLKGLSEKYPNIKMFRQGGVLKCANGSDLPIIGYTVLTVKLGDNSTETKFTVVQEIFPNVILGMKYMQSTGLSINPSKCRATINDCVIPFASQHSYQEN